MYRNASRPNSADTRFTISHFPTPHLDGARTTFGRVISGIDVIRSMQGDEMVNSIRILRRGAPLPEPIVLNGSSVAMPLQDLPDLGG
jgi:cyclophilin family peptidyl-prolyl cis-trans isomerase